MPTYSYQCTDCGDRFDAVQAFTDDTLTTCTKCSGRLRKLFGAVGVVFKGSGFYRNDSRAANGAKSASGSGAKPSSGNGADSGSGGSKSEKSTDSGAKSNGNAEKSTSSTTPAGPTPAGAAN